MFCWVDIDARKEAVPLKKDSGNVLNRKYINLLWECGQLNGVFFFPLSYVSRLPAITGWTT